MFFKLHQISCVFFNLKFFPILLKKVSLTFFDNNVLASYLFVSSFGVKNYNEHMEMIKCNRFKVRIKMLDRILYNQAANSANIHKRTLCFTISYLCLHVLYT